MAGHCDGTPWIVSGLGCRKSRTAIIARLKAQDQRSSVAVFGGPTYKQRVPYAARDVTDELIDGPTGSLAEGAEGANALSQSDPRAVMVVYGRNLAARDAVFDFLRALGLRPLEWGQLVTGTGSSAPYVGEVLEHAFQRAHAVVVILTPDDEARLREPFRAGTEPVHETELTPQARPNVLFEAGMAFGVHPDRTLLVQVGSVRPFSDGAGRHVVRTTAPTRRCVTCAPTASGGLRCGHVRRRLGVSRAIQPRAGTSRDANERDSLSERVSGLGRREGGNPRQSG